MKPVTRRDIRIDAVFDLETQGWTDHFICGGVYYSDGTYDSYTWEREEELFDALCAIRGPKNKRGEDTPGLVWAHNGGRFDVKWLLDWALARGIPCNAVGAGSSIICVDVGRTRFLDSKALVKISLKELTKGASVSKEKLGLDCIGATRGCTEEPGDCDGYCAINRNMPKPMLKRLLQYLEADCRSLFDALQRIRDYAQQNDLDLGISVGSSAWRNAKRLLELAPASLIPADHNFVREAYFGGRIPVCRPRASRGFEYDVNAMYPSRIAFEKLPIGRAKRLTGSLCRRAFGSAPGFYRARVHVPPMHLPPLPLRIGTRICYPSGVFGGTWSAPELQYAEECGVKILDIDEAVVFQDEAIIFDAWVKRMFDLRASAPGWDGTPNKKGPLGTWLKFYMNSLTGKFGARPDTERLLINPPIEEIEKNECTCSGMPCTCGAWVQVDYAGMIYAAPSWYIQPCAHIEWVSYCNAFARVELHRQAMSVDDGWDLCYGDTDGILTLNRRTRNLGDACGLWKEDEEWTDLDVRAPKVYWLRHQSDYKVRAKGLRLPRMTDDAGKPIPGRARKAIHMLESGEPIGKEAVLGFRAGARAGSFFAKDTLKRRINVGYGDRILEPGKDVTRAPTINEAFSKWGNRRFAD